MRKEDKKTNIRKEDKKMIKMITYNLCWEAFSAVKKNIDMRKCLVNSKNMCINNISRIILDFSEEYDFMAFQEASEKSIERLEFPSSFTRRYSYEKETQNMNTIITYYDHNKYTVKKIIKGNLSLNIFKKRPFIGIIFDEKVILINVHFPHEDFKKIIKNLIKKFSGEEEFLDPEYNIILCGDFNHNVDIFYINKMMIKYGNKKKIFYENTKFFNTCCRPTSLKNKEYFGQFDHIIQTFGKPIVYETLSDKKIESYTKDGFTYTSDHLPIYGEFINENLLGGINKEFYEKMIDNKIVKYSNILEDHNNFIKEEIIEKLKFYKKLIK